MSIDGDVAVCIDFGTSTSRITYHDPQDDNSYPIKDLNNEDLIPSVISFDQQQNDGKKTVFGFDATNKNQSEKIITEVKRFLGKNFTDIPKSYIDFYKGTLKGSNDGGCVFEISDDELKKFVRFTPEEIIAIELSYLKEILKRGVKECKFNRIIATYPSSYSQKQVELLKYAYKLAGIEVMDMMKEPSAALAEYRRLTKNNVTSAVIIDIGAGTTDICCCEYKDGKFVVLCNVGHDFLGGGDLDFIIYDMILDKLEEECNFKRKKIDIRHAKNDNEKSKINKMKKQVKKEAERIKINLSNNDDCLIDLDNFNFIDEDYMENEIQITKQEFENKIRETKLGKDKEKNFLELLEQTIDKAVIDSGKQRSDFEVVLLVGGSTRIPIIRQTIEKKFSKQQLCSQPGYDPMIAVSKGGSYTAHEMRNKNFKQFEKIVIPIGLEVNNMNDGLGLDILVNRGELTPIHKTRRYANDSSANYANFKLCKQISQFTREIIDVGTINGITEKPPGEVIFELTLDINENGDLSFSAKEIQSNNNFKSLKIKGVFSVEPENFKLIQEKIKKYLK